MVDLARALAPWWALPLAAAVHACAAFAVTFALGAILLRLARRAGGPDDFWPLRARALYPPRVALVVASLAVPAVLVALLPRARGDFLGGNGVVALCAALASVLAAVFWRRRLARLLGAEGWTLRRALAGAATRALVFYPHLWAMLAFCLAMPPRFGLATCGLFAAAILVLLWLARGGGFRIARAVGLAPPAPPGIAEDLHAAAARAGIPLAGVHMIELPEANAYALPFAARIGFTGPALLKLDRASLFAIGQHELAHLAEPARARWTRLSGILVLAPLLLARPLVAAGGLVALLLAVLLSLLVAKSLHRPLKALESRADAGAREAEPEKGVYASALERLYRVNLVPVVFRGTVHPHLYDRLVALGAPPPYPRPPPPSRGEGFGLWCLVVLCGAVLVLWGSVATVFFEGHPWVRIAIDGGHARDAGDLASAEHAGGRYDAAATLYGAAGEMQPDRPHWPAYRSMSLAAAGRVDEANEALIEAALRAREWPWPFADTLAEAQRRVDEARRR